MRYELIIGVDQNLRLTLRVLDHRHGRLLVEAQGRVAGLVLASRCLPPGHRACGRHPCERYHVQAVILACAAARLTLRAGRLAPQPTRGYG